MNHTENHQLLKLAQKGDKKAISQFVEDNQGLVYAVALKFNLRRSLELEDLTQLGNLGLLEAIKRYDFAKGFRFSTYAVYWIRQKILRGIQNHERLIRLPVYQEERFRKFLRQKADLEDKRGRSVTDDDMRKKYKYTKAEIREFSMNIRSFVPLDKQDEEGNRIGDLIPSEQERQSPEKEILLRAFKYLESRQAWVLMERYGLNEKQTPKTLEEIGKIAHRSRERIRQIEVLAMKELKKFKFALKIEAIDAVSA